MILYHYAHCPFCVRVRMALGYLNLPYQSNVLSYNNEDTPLKLTGVKMLPIFETDNGETLNESLDIIAKIDTNQKIKKMVYTDYQDEIENLLTNIGKEVHNMAMPYWIWTPEFDSKSREYFQKKKEKKRGSFKDLIPRRGEFEMNLLPLLKDIEANLKPFYKGEQLDLADIVIASHLWGMYVVPEFQFSKNMHDYLQRVKLLCNFNYHKDFWL